MFDLTPHLLTRERPSDPVLVRNREISERDREHRIYILELEQKMLERAMNRERQEAEAHLDRADQYELRHAMNRVHIAALHRGE